MQFLSDGELMHRFEYVCDEPGGTKTKPRGTVSWMSRWKLGSMDRISGLFHLYL